MPRIGSPLIPTSTSISSDPYSKSEKTRKPFHLHPPSRLSNSPASLFAVSLICLAIGVFSTLYSLYSLSSHPRTIPLSAAIRCGRPYDSNRARHSVQTTTAVEVGSKKHGGGGEADRPKVLGFVGVLTGYDSADRREVLRSTWFPSDPDGLKRLEQSTGLAFRFVIGRAKDAQKRSELEKEVNQFKDFIIINVEEESTKLPYKTLEYFKAAFDLFEADYYVKADDDIYLRPDRLATLLAKERTSTMTYIGCMKKGPVITDPKMKWFESQGQLIGNEYFLHAYGPMYILSAEVVASLASARNNSLRMFSNEDVTIGSWMLAMNVYHEDTRAICDPRCTPTTIAVWDVPKCSGLCNPATRLKELHEINMCSKSPTLPPDDDDDDK